MSCHHITKLSMEIPPQDNQWAKIQPEGLQNLPIYHDFWCSKQAWNKAIIDKWGQSRICKHCIKKFSSKAGLKNHICHRSDLDCGVHCCTCNKPFAKKQLFYEEGKSVALKKCPYQSMLFLREILRSNKYMTGFRKFCKIRLKNWVAGWFQYTLKKFFVLNCYEILNTFSTHIEMLYHGFQHTLKFSTHFQHTFYFFRHSFQHLKIFNMVFNTPWNFEHLSTHLESFDMVFNMSSNFQNIQHVLKLLKQFFNMFSAHFKLENLKHLLSNCNCIHPENWVKST